MKLSTKYYLRFTLLFAVFISVYSANSQQLTSDSILLDSLFANTLKFENLSLKVNIDPGDLADAGNLKGHIRIRRDSVIWCSINAIGGIEVARIFLTPDSVKIIERISDQYLEGDYSLLKNELGIQLSFNDIQGILLNQFFVYSGIRQPIISTLKKEVNEPGYSLHSNDTVGGFYLQTITYSPINKTIKRLKLDQPDKSKSLQLNYSETTDFEIGRLPAMLRFTISYPGFAESFSVEILKTNIEKDLNFPFKVPRKYRYNEH
jgi:hypothetical protein